MSHSLALALSFICLLFTACSHPTPKSIEDIRSESARLNQFFDHLFEAEILRYPTSQTYIGRKTNYGLLDNETEAYSLEEHELSKKHLKSLREFDYDMLDENTKLSYRILEYDLKQEIEGFKWRHHYFPLNQMFGYQSSTPSFMINMHEIENESDAEAYISRLQEIKRIFNERMVFLRTQEKLGIIPPAFVFPKVIEDSKNIVTGKPFTKGQDSPLYSDFKQKINKLKLSSTKKNQLLKKAEVALVQYVKPAYQDLISYVSELSQKNTQNLGAWSLPEGKDFYNFRLKAITTTDLNANEIHNIGLREVERIQAEMRKIMKQVNFQGSLQDFFLHMQSAAHLYPNTSAGRKAYLARVNEVLSELKPVLPKLFNTFPKSELVVKPVEAFREKSAGTAFYSGPAMEGNRPGIYYVNLYKMEDNPKYKLEALAYHEAIPGHHMQIAIAKELEELPKFRRDGGFTAYSEGWGLYAELLPKEIGFYQDPYSDFGRLAMEIWRAVRLVVDTGIHSKKWTREEAIKYMKANTPSAELETVKEIERYFIMPGQATAYKIGMMKILELREKARKKMGEKFDIRVFHDVVLKDGALPLQILEEKVDQLIKNN
ncbi:MAG: DUF885 domain-containing protein [Bdellovibrionales bacterium]|nr:DUF885 domain-containing protein [Bdellovibrionales bacterium]